MDNGKMNGELEGPWERALFTIFDVALAWCAVWSVCATVEAMRNGRRLDGIEQRLETAILAQARGDVAQERREDGVEDPAGMAEEEADGAAALLVKCLVAGGREVPEAGELRGAVRRLDCAGDEPDLKEELCGAEVGAGELEGPVARTERGDRPEDSVVPGIHAEDSTTSARKETRDE